MTELVVLAEDASGKPRLDTFISDKLPELSRSRVQKLIEQGQVLVNGEIARAGLKLRTGDTIAISVPEPEPLDAVAEDIPLDIVYEDAHLLVINKSAGMVTHPGAGVSSGTLVNAVLHHAAGSLSSIGGVVRPGIVHRLDKDTSGLIMVAKDDLTHIGLSAQLKQKTARRSYLALVEGKPADESGTINLPLGRHPTKRKEMTVMREGTPGIAREAITHYKVVKRFSKYTLLAMELETGRTHQIRVHLAHLNLPIVGDLIYNHKTSGSEQARHKLGLRGQALHAYKLSFTHPALDKLLSFEVDLPADFSKLLETLK